MSRAFWKTSLHAQSAFFCEALALSLEVFFGALALGLKRAKEGLRLDVLDESEGKPRLFHAKSQQNPRKAAQPGGQDLYKSVPTSTSSIPARL